MARFLKQKSPTPTKTNTHQAPEPNTNKRRTDTVTDHSHHQDRNREKESGMTNCLLTLDPKFLFLPAERVTATNARSEAAVPVALSAL